jgi:hypothetical protein
MPTTILPPSVTVKRIDAFPSAPPNPKVVVLRAHSPEQMAKVVDCIHAGHPVTIYADHLTDEIKRFSGLSFVQTRIGQKNVPLVEDESTFIFH